MNEQTHAGSRNVRLAYACTLALMLCSTRVAAAQDSAAAETQSHRVAGWSFTPSVAIGTIHDTNVALSAPDATVGQTQGDALLNIVPGGQLEFIGRRSDFSLNYRGFLRRYLDVEGLDGFDQRGSIGFRRAMTRRLSLSVRDSFANSPTTDEIEVNGVPFRRTGSRTNTFSGAVDYRLTRFISLASRYDSTWVAFDRPDIYLTGGRIHGVRNEVSYQLSRRFSAGGEYGLRRASLDDGQREFQFQDAGAVVRYAVGRHTSANAAVGHSRLQDLNLRETRSGAYVRVGLGQELERATVGVGFERQYVPAFGFGGASSSQQLHGFVRMPLRGARLYTQTSLAWRRTLPFEAEELELDSLWFRSTVGYAAARWMRVEALYTYTRQDSIVTGGEVDRHRVGVQFVVSQPMRIQ